ncbi:uncharacterized protein LOC114516943 [Dendronephthya gigantea]|uniref:uncharacterized protein LOC114516943 n=1 Tax=Dendronephthya gigantea TaxID=151771 RepID=UPI00106CECB0|nr:uncharacterized protein LOC114516943 [Dendronephthya gigantea]
MIVTRCWSLIFLLVTLFASCVHVSIAKKMRQRKRDSCVYEQHVNQCSTPTDYVPYRDTFATACDEHDVCYFCETRYSITRNQCDAEFRRKMYEICDGNKRKRFLWSALGNLLTGNVCKAAADVYFDAVDNFAHDHYENPSPSWCEKSCVQARLSKYFSIVV